MEEVHLNSLLICKQQVLFHFIHFHFHVLDADGLRDSIILHSMYSLVKEGMQSKERYLVPLDQSIEDIPTDIEHLYFCGFCDYLQNELILSNNSFQQLKSITIGDHCFQHVSEFVIDGLERLESVKIGNVCFRNYDDSIFRITNCPNLWQLEIGDDSFQYFKSFELSNVNSLQSINFGDLCFHNADFSLKGE